VARPPHRRRTDDEKPDADPTSGRRLRRRSPAHVRADAAPVSLSGQRARDGVLRRRAVTHSRAARCAARGRYQRAAPGELGDQQRFHNRGAHLAGQPLSAVRTMEDVVRVSTARPRLLSVLTGVFALLAGLLAAVGTYGIMAYSVSQQTREIGIRMAMGADPAAVIRVVLRDGVTLIAAGVALGAAGAFALTHVL